MVWVIGRGEGEKEEILNLSCLWGIQGAGRGGRALGLRGAELCDRSVVAPISKPQAYSPVRGSGVQAAARQALQKPRPEEVSLAPASRRPPRPLWPLPT